MSRSRFACENCGSSNVRRSHRHSGLEYLRALSGEYPLRCEDCQHRFCANILMLSQMAFARCPQCLSFALSTWDPKQYRIPRWRRLLLRLGAHRYRCQVCRVNFVSFRLAKG